MVASSFMFSICTLSSYSPESERAAWRTKNTVSVSLVRTFTREESTGAPPFVHTTWGRGFPWVGSREQRSAGSPPVGTDPGRPTLTPATHLEGDEEVDRLPYFAEVSLAEMAREANLGLL